MARAIAPVVGMHQMVRYQTRSASAVYIAGSTDQFLDTSGFSIAEGRFMTPGEAEGGRPVCIIGSEVATNLFVNASPLGKRINIELKLEEVPEIWINRELMGWVIENLIRNAVDSIEVEAGLITISTSYHADEKTVHLSLEDNGKGIPREHVKHIFNPGFTTKKRGWGLGLSLCRRIVNEYHEGKIYVEKSQKDVGTQFEIVLPLAPERSTRKKP